MHAFLIFIFCKASVNSNHPIGIKTSDSAYFFFLGGGTTCKGKTVLKHTFRVLEKKTAKCLEQVVIQVFCEAFFK